MGKVGVNSSDRTGEPEWWTQHVPVWTRATEQGVRTSLYQWGRCDVPFGGAKTTPEKCKILNNTQSMENPEFESNLFSAVKDLEEGFGLSMVYHDSIDAKGHNKGPDTDEELCSPDIFQGLQVTNGVYHHHPLIQMNKELFAVDEILGKFFKELTAKGLKDTTNVVIVSDHGDKIVTYLYCNSNTE